MTSRRLGLALAALALALVATIALALRAHGVQTHETASATTAASLAARHASLVRDVLAVRAGTDRNYDRVTADVQVLRGVGALDGALAKSAVDEDHATEIFKTSMALYWSATLAFPAAARAVAPPEAERAAIDALRTDVHRFVTQPDGDKAEQVRTDVTRIESAETTLDDAGRKRRAIALGLAKSIIEHRESVDRIVGTFTASTLGVDLARVGAQHAKKAGRAAVVAATAATSTVFVLAVAIALLISAAAARPAVKEKSRATTTPSRSARSA